MREDLLEETSLLLLRHGFIVKTLKGAFDLVARDSERIILLKVLEDANSLSEFQSGEIRKVASCLRVPLLIVSNKAGNPLDDNVIYSRCGIYTLNLLTFRRCIEDQLPIIRKSRAGLTAKINSEKLRAERASLGISINELSKRLGVSRSMAQKYENGNSEITLAKAAKMYKLFGESVFEKENILRGTEGTEIQGGKSVLAKKYGRLGFTAVETRKVPFDMIAKKERSIILTKIGDKPSPVISNLSKLIGAGRLAIFEKEKPKNMPALTKKEFLDFEEGSELLKFIKEFEEEHED
jgi:predicted transcriptional regulator